MHGSEVELAGFVEGGHVEAVEEVADVLVDGLIADAQCGGGLLAGEIGVFEEGEDFLLALGEREAGGAADGELHGKRGRGMTKGRRKAKRWAVKNGELSGGGFVKIQEVTW